MNSILKLKRTFFTILFLFLFLYSNAQKTDKYFDYAWKECKPTVARFYSQIIKTDSGYNRKDYYVRERKLLMSGNFKDSLLQIKTGKFHYFHSNGYLKSFGTYVNNKKEGLWLSYHDNRVISDSTAYLHDKPLGVSLSWHPNGYLSDSVFTNEDGSGTSLSWFDNGFLSSVGQFSIGQKLHGLWKFYHNNGKISSLETYLESELIDKKYFDENGIRMSITTNNDRYPEFPGGKKVWQKYLDNHIFFPSEYKIMNSEAVTIIVSFTINEKGMLENVYASTPFDKNFDQIAVEAIKKSPQWIPAIEHNRRVKFHYNQLVNFKQFEW